MKEQALYLLLSLGMAGSAAEAQRAEQPRMEQPHPDAIYGERLMSEEEKEMYRSHMRALDAPRERQAFDQAHRQRMDERAGEHGMTVGRPGPSAAEVPQTGEG